VRARITRWALHRPGVDDGAVPAAGAKELLGRRGLRHKEPATILALCAVHRALGRPPGRTPPESVCPDIAVVASSNLGNVGTVADVARTVDTEGLRGVSPLSAPNASSNVVASSVAQWFGFGGPNLMVCSGATSGLDAFALACLLLRAGRARRVVLVGAESADDVATGLSAGPLRDGAACVLLDATGDAPLRAFPAPDYPAWPEPPDSMIGPDGAYGGAHGVIGLALAARTLAGTPGRTVGVVCGDESDGWRAALVSRRADD
jgi:3-oxoacyl-[acyl-carrier-protein] synthase II